MISMLRCCTNRITFSVQTKIVSRKYMTISEKMEILLKQRDHIPQHYKLIYRDKNHTFVGCTYHALNFMSFMTVGVVGYAWYTDKPIQKNAKHFTLSKKPYEAVILGIGIIGVFTVSFWLRQRFVLRVYFSEKAKNYRIIFIGRLPFTCEYKDLPAKSLTFAAPKDSAFPWRNTVFKADRRKVYLFEDNFRTHSDFFNMLKPGEELQPAPE